MNLRALAKDPIVRRALTSIAHQRARCNNPKHPYYRYYGAKGIRVEYGTRDFIAWYVAELKRFDGRNPTVGRIDHSKNYRFDNIRFESREENSSESLRRRGWENQNKKVRVIPVGGSPFIAESIGDASEKTGVSIATVSRHVNGHAKRPWSNFRFEAL